MLLFPRSYVFFFKYKASGMQYKRQHALKELKRLAENIINCMEVLSDNTWEEEIRQICTWVNGDGTRSNLAEIQEQIESIKSKVREWLISSLPIMYFIHLACLFFGRIHNSGRSCWNRFNLLLFKIQLYQATWRHIKLGLI